MLFRNTEKRDVFLCLAVDDYVVVNIELIVDVDDAYLDVTVSTLLLVGTVLHTLDHLRRNSLRVGPRIKVLEELLLMLQWMTVQRCRVSMLDLRHVLSSSLVLLGLLPVLVSLA